MRAVGCAAVVACSADQGGAAPRQDGADWVAALRQLDAAILDRNASKHIVFTALGEEIVAGARKALTALEALAEAASAARRR